MSIFDIFSKRQRLARGEVPDVYQYENLPNKLRVQIIYIIRDGIGNPRERRGSNNPYTLIHDALSREYGRFQLHEQGDSDEQRLFNFFLQTEDNELALDVVELSFRYLDKVSRGTDYVHYASEVRSSPDEAIEELNARFREHGVGFEYQSGELIRIDSQLLHKEAIKPVLLILSEHERFKIPNEEFLKAYEHYRHQRFKEAIAEALKAFESTMKVICHNQKWEYSKNDPAHRLIARCIDNGLIPSCLQNQLQTLRSLLESGLPTVRNKTAGHGQGTEPVKVDLSLVTYALHLAAANILLLTSLEQNISK